MAEKNKYNGNALNCRVDTALLKLKKDGETNREFVERALICLRDGAKKGTEDELQYSILLKLIKAFIDKRLVVKTITEQEGDVLVKLIEKEGLA